MTWSKHLLLLGLFAVSLPAAADQPARPRSGTAQVASHESGLALSAIERRLYQQGYHRISHLRLEEAGLYSARALDREGDPVFLGVAPDTGQVVEALLLK